MLLHAVVSVADVVYAAVAVADPVPVAVVVRVVAAAEIAPGLVAPVVSIPPFHHHPAANRHEAQTVAGYLQLLHVLHLGLSVPV